MAAVDGSERSIQTVRYLAALPAFRDAEVHLLHVFDGLPESYYDMDSESAGIKIMSGMTAWEQAHREKIETYFEKCRKILLAADFHPQRIKTILRQRQAGIARDIASAAGNHYDALVLRRRGKSRLSGMIMGSVATKLLYHTDALPLILAGSKSRNKRLLIGMDLSANAMRAVDFAGRMTARYGYEVGLVAVLRGKTTWALKDVSGPAAEYAPHDAESRILEQFDHARERLVAAGTDPAKIETDIIKNVPSRSGAIVDWAQKGDYSTIVLGRKGVSQSTAFSLGRVADKIIQVGRRHHIWLVN